MPDSITGFPTIRLYPAGAKDAPVEYNGSRTVEDFVNFIKENGKHKVDAHASGSKKAEEGVTSAPSESQTGEAGEKDAHHDEL